VDLDAFAIGLGGLCHSFGDGDFEHARQTAPLKFPSFSLAATWAAKDSRGSRVQVCSLWLRLDWIGDVSGSASSLICLFTSESRFQQWPPLLEHKGNECQNR